MDLHVSPKKKYTFHLSKDVYQALENIYIKRRQEDRKSTFSDLIAESVLLLEEWERAYDKYTEMLKG